MEGIATLRESSGSLYGCRFYFGVRYWPRLCENYFGKLKVVNYRRYPTRNELYVGAIIAYL